jgi:hypothetical protein
MTDSDHLAKAVRLLKDAEVMVRTEYEHTTEGDEWLAEYARLLIEVEPDPHRLSPDVHWRLYLDKDGKAVIVCVQSWDYPDYDAGRFLSSEAYTSEEDAKLALVAFQIFRKRVR